MYTITAAIQENDTGPQVANLYAALQFLIDKDAFSFIDLSELNPLKDQLRSEAPSGFYKGAAVKLMVHSNFSLASVMKASWTRGRLMP